MNTMGIDHQSPLLLRGRAHRRKLLRHPRALTHGVVAGVTLGLLKKVPRGDAWPSIPAVAAACGAACGACAVLARQRRASTAAATCEAGANVNGCEQSPVAGQRARPSGARALLREAGAVAAVGGACQAFQVLFHNAFCGWAFRCGCVWPWAGGWDCCNVHNATGPKCPWCLARESVSWTTDCLVLALMVIAHHEAVDRGLPRWVPLAAPPAVFLVVGLAVAAGFKLATGYPYFLVGPVHGKQK